MSDFDLEEEIDKLESKMEDEGSHTQRAFWKGWKNIYEAYKENDIEDIEHWLHEKRQSAESLTNGQQLDAHMLGSGEIEAIEELEEHLTLDSGRGEEQ